MILLQLCVVIHVYINAWKLLLTYTVQEKCKCMCLCARVKIHLNVLLSYSAIELHKVSAAYFALLWCKLIF